MSWTKKITHPSEAIKKGDLVRAVVLSVDTEKRRVALGMKQLEQDPWQDEIPRRYGPGDIVMGHVTKITNFGVFVSLEDGLEGLLHISELTDRKVESPEEVVKFGQAVDVRVLKVDSEERKIGLSMIGVPQHSYLLEEEVERMKIIDAEQAAAKAAEAAAEAAAAPAAEAESEAPADAEAPAAEAAADEAPAAGGEDEPAKEG